MPTVNVTIRMDSDLKKQTEQLFNDFGFNLTTGFIMFAKQAVREQRIPFEISKKTAIKPMEREKLIKIAKEVYEEHPKIYKELAK